MWLLLIRIHTTNRFIKRNIPILNSRQFYRELNAGTAKPTKEELKRIPHYFINTHAITEEFNVGNFEKSALGLLNKLFKEHEILIMVGGSGLFCKAVWEGLDELPRIDKGLRSVINEEVSKNGLVELQDRRDRRSGGQNSSCFTHNVNLYLLYTTPIC